MIKELDAVFGAEEPEVEAPLVEEPKVDAEAETEQSAPDPKPEAEQVPEQPAVKDEPERMIPLAAHLDERDRRKAERDRADRLERELAEERARHAHKPDAEVPDPIDDPNGFTGYLQQQIQAAEMNSRFNLSETLAREKHGAETVDAVMQWGLQKANENAAFKADLLRQPDPIGWAIRQHKRDEIVNQIGDNDVDTFVKNYVATNAERLGLSSSPPPQHAASQPATPPRSLASSPATGDLRDVPTGPMAALEAVFKP